MSAIDFRRLRQEAKRQAKKSPQPKVTATTETSPQPWPEWTEENSLTLRPVDIDWICEDPKAIGYAQQVLDETTQTALSDWLAKLPSGASGLGEWKTMTYGKRRVCMLGEAPPNSSSLAPPLPPPLERIAQQMVQAGLFPSDQPPNHVLLNDYQPSQGILPHTDGPLYASRTATISLGTCVLIEFTPRLSSDQIGRDTTAQNKQVVLHPGSVVVFQQDAYDKYCHGISEVWQDTTTSQCLNAPPGLVIPRGQRYSLTFRHKLE